MQAKHAQPLLAGETRRHSTPPPQTKVPRREPPEPAAEPATEPRLLLRKRKFLVGAFLGGLPRSQPDPLHARCRGPEARPGCFSARRPPCRTGRRERRSTFEPNIRSEIDDVAPCLRVRLVQHHRGTPVGFLMSGRARMRAEQPEIDHQASERFPYDTGKMHNDTRNTLFRCSILLIQAGTAAPRGGRRPNRLRGVLGRSAPLWNMNPWYMKWSQSGSNR